MTQHVVTLHSNPCGYVRPLANYWRFREELPASATLHTVEISYSGEFEIDDALQIHATPDQLMWQKERALILGLEQLVPADVDVVTFCDADLIFKHAGPFAAAEQQIRTGTAIVVQPFAHFHRLLPDESIERSQITQAAAWSGVTNCYDRAPCPGGCWTMPRVIAERIYSADICGGGDTTQVFAWRGDFAHDRFRAMNPAWRRHVLREMVWQYQQVRRQIGYVPGVCRHLFHGHLSDRQYGQRNTLAASEAFDPEADITLADNGLWRWSSDKPRLHQYFADLFAKRKEDG